MFYDRLFVLDLNRSARAPSEAAERKGKVND